jgi:hypothetical protein
MPDFAIGNVVGESYCFMALCPIRRAALGSPNSFASRIRDYLARLPTGAESPFAKITSIHLCRLLIIDDVPYEGFPAQRDHLQSSYLLFSASIAGDLTSCLTDFVALLPDVIHNVWVNCVEFPGVESPYQFIAYLKKCQINTSFFFGGYPQASLLEVMNALLTQKLFTRFLIATQGSNPVELKERFNAFMDDLRKQPSPCPGTL